MTILRNPHRLQYVCISNTCLEDKRISWEARGLLAYLLSRPDKWQIKTKHLQEVGNCGRDKILRIYSELEDAGYLRRKTRQDAAGRLAGKEIEISESADFPTGGVSRLSGFPTVGKADPIVSTEFLSSTEAEASTDVPVETSSKELSTVPIDTKSLRTAKNADSRTPGSIVWDHYAEAYQHRYGIAPVRNLKSNSLCKQLVDRLGADDAPRVAAFYVGHSNQFYVARGHCLNLLVGDAEKIRTEWMTGNRITNSQARQADRLQGTGDMWRRVGAAYEARTNGGTHE